MKNRIILALAMLTLVVLVTSCASQKYGCPGNPSASTDQPDYSCFLRKSLKRRFSFACLSTRRYTEDNCISCCFPLS